MSNQDRVATFGIDVPALSDADTQDQRREKARQLLTLISNQHRDYIAGRPENDEAMPACAISVPLACVTGDRRSLPAVAGNVFGMLCEEVDRLGFSIVGFAPAIFSVEEMERNGCEVDNEGNLMIGWRLEMSETVRAEDLYGECDDDEEAQALMARMWMETSLESIGPMYVRMMQAKQERRSAEQEVTRMMEQLKNGRFEA